MELIDYNPPGPAALEFHKSDGFVRGLMGPVGSGKSSSSCVEIVMRALRQEPWHDGVRRSRWLVIRNTYPELRSTTIKTWQQWFPESICPFKWDAPIEAKMNIPDIGDGTSLELEVYFMALDRPTETGKLRSLELTGVWINEASEIGKEIFDMVTQRVGRYPSKLKGGPSWCGVILDTNPPDDDHWYYKIAEEERPKGWEFFRQQGGLIMTDEDDDRGGVILKDVGKFIPNPMAENVRNLPGGYNYYMQQVPAKSMDWINVFVLGNYGTTSTGKPVYPEWNDKSHTGDTVYEPVDGLPIVLGWDFGLTPACVVMQITPRGKIVVLDEYVSEDMGIRQFAHDVVKPAIANKYGRCRIESVGDPAGNIRAQTDERTCLQELWEAGLATDPAPTNDFVIRRESVAYWLTKMADGAPAFYLNPHCTWLRKGFNGRYRLERIKTNGPARFRDRPVKDEYSHIHDALQYACMKMRTGLNPVRAKSVKRTSAKGWT